MSAVEHKSPTFFLDGTDLREEHALDDSEPWDEEENADWGSETMEIGKDNFRWGWGWGWLWGGLVLPCPALPCLCFEYCPVL